MASVFCRQKGTPLRSPMTSFNSFWPLKSAISVASLALAPPANGSSGSCAPPPPPLAAANSLEDRLVRATAAIRVAASRDAANSLEGRRVRATAAICVAASRATARSLEGRRVRAIAAICAAAAAAACCWRSITHLASVCASVQLPSDEHSRMAL
eukprot:scaffold40831_cov99-Phaeocystis_antarctica.AAC.1